LQYNEDINELYKVYRVFPEKSKLTASDKENSLTSSDIIGPGTIWSYNMGTHMAALASREDPPKTVMPYTRRSSSRNHTIYIRRDPDFPDNSDPGEFPFITYGDSD
jgi:hypothetical protein